MSFARREQGFISPRMVEFFRAFESEYIASDGKVKLRDVGNRLGIGRKAAWVAAKKLEIEGALVKSKTVGRNGRSLYQPSKRGLALLPVLGAEYDRARYTRAAALSSCAWCGTERRRAKGFKALETGDWYCSIACLTEDSDLHESSEPPTPENAAKG